MAAPALGASRKLVGSLQVAADVGLGGPLLRLHGGGTASSPARASLRAPPLASLAARPRWPIAEVGLDGDGLVSQRGGGGLVGFVPHVELDATAGHLPGAGSPSVDERDRADDAVGGDDLGGMVEDERPRAPAEQHRIKRAQQPGGGSRPTGWPRSSSSPSGRSRSSGAIAFSPARASRSGTFAHLARSRSSAGPWPTRYRRASSASARSRSSCGRSPNQSALSTKGCCWPPAASNEQPVDGRPGRGRSASAWPACDAWPAPARSGSASGSSARGRPALSRSRRSRAPRRPGSPLLGQPPVARRARCGVVSACSSGSSSDATRCSVPRFTQVMTSERSTVSARSTSDACPPRVRARTASRAPRGS